MAEEIMIHRSKSISLLAMVTGLVLVTGAVLSCGKGDRQETGGNGSGNEGNEKTEDTVTEISTLKVMSFNILRGDLNGPDHLWTSRREACLAMIADEQPMLFGLQECTWTQRRHILEADSRLNAVGVAVDGQKKDYTNVSSNPIFWRTDILSLEDWGTFWLSDTPDAIGSITWNGVKPRTCTWARFKVRCNGKRLIYFNAHVENAAGEETKDKSIRLIVDRMREANPSLQVPMLFGGDMNSKASASCLAAMMTYLTHAPSNCQETDKGRTLNSFKATGGSAIDHLFYNKEGFTGKKFWVNRKEYKNVTYISDHYPIFCELEFN